MYPACRRSTLDPNSILITLTILYNGCNTQSTESGYGIYPFMIAVGQEGLRPVCRASADPYLFLFLVSECFAGILDALDNIWLLSSNLNF